VTNKRPPGLFAGLVGRVQRTGGGRPAVCEGLNMQKVDWPVLRRAALQAMGQAYAPYSQFPVGAAALVDDGRIVVGCNVENASYGLTLCAECGLVSALHAGGGGSIVALACVDFRGDVLMPCGRCRQLLWEHGGPDLLIDTAEGPMQMIEILPLAFTREDLG
jgi:cytidine deaminase